MSRYDRKTTTFSPDGRLHQVEYSLESINQAGFTCGIRTKEGVIFLGEKKSATKLIDLQETKKFSQVDDHIVAAVAGLVSDATLLTNFARKFSMYHAETYGELPHPEIICQRLGDIMQQVTQRGGLRPYGVTIMFAGYTEEKGFQLLSVDPSGNYCEYHAHSCGQNSSAAQTLLKPESQKIADMTFEEGLKLAAKISVKCTDIGGDASKIDVACLVLRDGKPSFELLDSKRVQAALDIAQEENKDDDDN